MTCSRCGAQYVRELVLRCPILLSACGHAICVRCLLDLFDLNVNQHWVYFLQNKAPSLLGALQIQYHSEQGWLSDVQVSRCAPVILKEISQPEYLQLTCPVLACARSFRITTTIWQAPRKDDVRFLCPCPYAGHDTLLCDYAQSARSLPSLLQGWLLDHQNRPRLWADPLHVSCSYSHILRSFGPFRPGLDRPIQLRTLTSCLLESWTKQRTLKTTCFLGCDMDIGLLDRIAGVPEAQVCEKITEVWSQHLQKRCRWARKPDVKALFKGVETKRVSRKRKQQQQPVPEIADEGSAWCDTTSNESIDALVRLCQKSWKAMSLENTARPSATRVYGWTSWEDILQCLEPRKTTKGPRKKNGIPPSGWRIGFQIFMLLSEVRGLPMTLCTLVDGALLGLSHMNGLSTPDTEYMATFRQDCQAWSQTKNASSRVAAFYTQSKVTPMVFRLLFQLVQTAYQTANQTWRGWQAEVADADDAPIPTTLQCIQFLYGQKEMFTWSEWKAEERHTSVEQMWSRIRQLAPTAWEAMAPVWLDYLLWSQHGDTWMSHRHEYSDWLTRWGVVADASASSTSSSSSSSTSTSSSTSLSIPWLLPPLPPMADLTFDPLTEDETEDEMPLPVMTPVPTSPVDSEAMGDSANDWISFVAE